MIKFTIPVKTTNPLNGSQGRTRGAVLAKAAQRKKQRMTARFCAVAAAGPFPATTTWLPKVTITRVSAGTLDTDGLAASLKSIRDGLADYFGVGDGATDPITWHYAQRKGKRGEYAVEVDLS
jgi:hypothetical protein